MAATSSYLGEQSNPLDRVERLAEKRSWPIDRTSEDEVVMSVAGAWCGLDLSLSWREDLETLEIVCAFDMKFGDQRRAEAVGCGTPLVRFGATDLHGHGSRLPGPATWTLNSFGTAVEEGARAAGPPSAVVAEFRHDLFDLQPRIADAVAAETDQFGRPLDLRGQHIDVDIGALQLTQDGLEFGKCLGVAGGVVATGTTVGPLVHGLGEAEVGARGGGGLGGRARTFYVGQSTVLPDGGFRRRSRV